MQLSHKLRLFQNIAIAAFTVTTLFLACSAYKALTPSMLTTTALLGPKPLVPAKQDLSDTVWQTTVFRKHTLKNNIAGNTPLAQRYRLAGTFFAKDQHLEARKAIIDDLQANDQFLIGENDRLGDASITVVSINNDSILLRTETHEEQLWLSFAGGPAAPTMTPNQITATSATDMLTRFGTRVEDRRWLLKREALLDYYKEVMADTTRLANVFESLKPVYKDSRISGYVLDIEGEKNMFNAFGLRQNDVIRKVNSMPMTSQSRAEYFIMEFVKDRVNGFVMDIERDGKPQKFVYLIR